MAAVARVIDIVFLEQEVVVAVMNVMTVTTGHLAEAQRVPGRTIGVRANRLVTAETDFLLLQRVENRVTVFVDFVTGHTGDVLSLMSTAEPSEVRMVLMAAYARFVLFGNGGLIAFAKGAFHRHFRLFLGFEVFVRRTMAGFTLQIRERRIRIDARTMWRVENGHYVPLRTLMALQTVVSPFLSVFLRCQDSRHY